MKRNVIKNMLLLGLFVFVIGSISIYAGTATATATAEAGNKCGDISKKRNQNTGAMEVLDVEVNGTPLRKAAYIVTNNGSTRPKIEFVTPLAAGDVVKVTLSTGKKGTYEVNLDLHNCR